MRVFRTAVVILASLVLLTSLAPPAQAAVPKIPITCGMVVQRDAVVYLAKDLYCPEFGVLVQDVEELPTAHVVADLRGHTLRGPGTGYGITAFNGDAGGAVLKVINGRLENWDLAVGGDHDTSTRNLSLVRNRIGFFCNGSCEADRTTFEGNKGTGFYQGEANGGVITRSIFVRNKVGASSNFIWPLSISSSAFLKNDVGVLGVAARVWVAKSLFVKNRTAIRIVNDNGDEGLCATLSRVVFVKNKVQLDGLRCAA